MVIVLLVTCVMTPEARGATYHIHPIDRDRVGLSQREMRNAGRWKSQLIFVPKLTAVAAEIKVWG